MYPNHSSVRLTISNSSFIRVNLKDYMDPDEYKETWRYRITRFRVYFLDGSDHVIKNNDTNKKFGMTVNYPSTFYDIDSQKVPHLFAAHPHFCRSIYVNSGFFTEDWVSHI